MEMNDRGFDPALNRAGFLLVNLIASSRKVG
jgi:hypothetical protein